MSLPQFPLAPETSELGMLRQEVRSFLSQSLPQGWGMAQRAWSWTGFNERFSAALGERGWLGMTLPRRYGGHERTAIERHVVVEELLAAGAPVAAHWIADRQSAPLILRFGSEALKASILPRIAAGTCFFCIGMSEPGSGSDLASVRTHAKKTGSGFRLNGSKLWTTYAHRAHYMIVFCRTGASESRHGGFSQFLVDMRLPGVTVRPVRDIAGEHHMNEVFFQDVELEPDALIGTEGDGWRQVMSELALERSGPERFLSSFVLLDAWFQEVVHRSADAKPEAFGRLMAHLLVLRQMSLSVAGMLANGQSPDLSAAVVKDLGALFEQEIPEAARVLLEVKGGCAEFLAAFQRTLLMAPSFSLRGGTREILRGIIARGLALR